MKIEDYLVSLKQRGYTPDSILDIGANVGSFSRFCKKLWSDSNILMFEGNDNCEKDLINTGIDYKIALLGDTNRTVKFYINPENPKCTGSSYYKEITHHYDNSVVIEKELSMLDDLVDDVYNLIKIDTQGSELDIMKGGEKTMKKSDYIIIEVAMKEYNEGSPLYEDIISYMNSIGFNKKEEIEKHYWMSDSPEFKRGEVFQIDIIFSK